MKLNKIQYKLCGFNKRKSYAETAMWRQNQKTEVTRKRLSIEKWNLKSTHYTFSSAKTNSNLDNSIGMPEEPDR